MEKVVLQNGLTLVLCNRKVQNLDYTLSITFKCGHINEPKLGLAALYEKIVSTYGKSLTSFCGGNITSFYTGGKDGWNDLTQSIEYKIPQLFHDCIELNIMDHEFACAIHDIVQHTRDLAPLPMRQTKLAYKHIAFAKDDVVWNTKEYIKAVKSLTLQDIKDYIRDNFVGSNIVIGFTGDKADFEIVTKLVKRYFGILDKGTKHKVKKLLYTGGCQFIKGCRDTKIAMFGWDISKHTNFSKINVMMSMLSARLERCMAESKIAVNVDVKIAGYFGFRTLRICVSTNNDAYFRNAIAIVCKNVRRLQEEYASDRRLETSRQRAMTERLAAPDDRLPRSIEAAWLLLGRGKDYNNDSCIDNMWQVDAVDIQDTAKLVFSENLTYVVYSSAAVPSYQKVLEQMGC